MQLLHYQIERIVVNIYKYKIKLLTNIFDRIIKICEFERIFDKISVKKTEKCQSQDKKAVIVLPRLEKN